MKEELRFSFRGLDIECDVIREQDAKVTPGNCIVLGLEASIEDRAMFESCLPDRLLRKLDRGETEFVVDAALCEWLDEIEEGAARATR